MNHDANITRMIDAIKQDKAITQPWRNKAIARLDEAQAFVMMGQRMTNMKPPEGLQVPASGSNPNQDVGCTCPPGARDRACPVHGDR